MKMRATMKLDNAGAARNTVAGRTFAVACSLEGAIAISTNLELV